MKGYIVCVYKSISNQEKLQEYADAGATDFAASIFKTGKNDAENAARTKDLLKNLVGKI